MKRTTLLNAALAAIGFLVPDVTAALELGEKDRAIALEANKRYRADDVAPDPGARNHAATGPYMGYGITRHFSDHGERVQVDDAGLPLVKHGDQWYYSPVTVAQQALAEYSREEGPTPQFKVAVDKLLEMQNDVGAFRYPIAYHNYALGWDYQPGWVSAMAQGQALSAFARAYHLTKDGDYLDAGNKALTFMLTPFEKGGTLTTAERLDPSLAGYPFLMEFPSDPPVYTLNGYMFTILGLYDWWQATGSELAKVQFEQHMRTLVAILPYYDLGTMTAYDLSYRTVKGRAVHVLPAYHVVHIEQLWALHAVTGNELLKDTADRWLAYVTK